MNDAPAYILTFGKSAFVGFFAPVAECDLPLERDTGVVVQTERGLETGRVLGRGTGFVPASRAIIRRFDDADRAMQAELTHRENSLFGEVRNWLGKSISASPLLDVEMMFDNETILLHGFWNEDQLKDEIIAEFQSRFRLRPSFYDAKSELIVEKPEKEAAGCGKEGCGTSGGGGCSTGGGCSPDAEGKSGCSTGSCSRGTFKKPAELKNYLLGLREKMEAASSRVPLH